MIPRQKLPLLLFLNILIIATSGLVYELLAGTIASYVLGDSVTQFSLVIGIYLSAMGIGAWLSGFLSTQVARAFLEVELGVALLGGCSAPILFLSFAHPEWFRVVLFGFVVGIGILVGLELPLLMRILKQHLDFKNLVSRALAFDYMGALIASLLFPLLLVPKMGLVRTSLVFGLVNALIGLWGTWILLPILKQSVSGLRARAVIVVLLLGAGLVKAEELTSLSEEDLFVDEVVYSKTTPYQRVVLTRGAGGFALFLNGNLQFSSMDEYRYHEALVHPAMTSHPEPRRILVLGGGDGLAVREVLRYPTVESVTLVDLDPDMTRLGKSLPLLSRLNEGSLSDPRVHVVNEDAFVWLGQTTALFDVALVDFPDPNSYSLGKLYTTHFYNLLRKRLSPSGVFSVQATSPLFARKSFWCIVETLKQVGLEVRPYHVPVPSFGEWGFVLAGLDSPMPTNKLPNGLRYLQWDMMASLFVMSKDMQPLASEINRLNDQVLVRYYENEWRRWE